MKTSVRKRICLVVLFVACAALSANAQLVETYPTSQRYLFNIYNEDSAELYQPLPALEAITSMYWVGQNNQNNIVAQKYACSRGDSVQTVYGVALPIMFFVIPSNVILYDTFPFYSGFGLNEELLANDSLVKLWWDAMIDSITKPEKTVCILQRNNTGTEPVSFVDSTTIKIGVNTVAGNRFQFPNLGNWPIHDSLQYSLQYPTLEVYFDQPVQLADTFWAGATTLETLNHGAYALGSLATFFGIQDPSCPRIVYTYCPTCPSGPVFTPTIESMQQQLHVDCIIPNTYNGWGTWGGPFAIVTPPPCMPPHNLQVHQTQHYDSLLLTWQTPVAVSHCRLEYGHAGFVDGTGTIVDSITDGQWLVTGLDPASAYDFRVKAWCIYDSAYSPTTDTTYTTPDACPGKFSNAVYNITDSSLTVRWTLPELADYGELRFRPQGAGDDEDSVVSPVTPDAYGWCTVHLTGLQPGVTYQIRIRNWCPYGNAFSDYETLAARTLVHYTISAVPNNDAWGSVTGGGTYVENAQVTLVATPAEGGMFHFVAWNDGVTSRIRAFQATSDLALTAFFICDTCIEGFGTPAGRNEDRAIQLVPNPATDEVSVLSNSAITRVEVYDLQGKLVLEHNSATPTQHTTQLSTASLHAGTYTVRIHTLLGTANKRLVVK